MCWSLIWWGYLFQSNQAAVQISSMLELDGGSSGFLIGLMLSMLVGIVIIGGIGRIAKITEKIVPIILVYMACIISYHIFKLHILMNFYINL